MLRWLPSGAAVWQSLGIDSAWSNESHLLAGVIDLLAGANWQRGGGKGQRPKPIPRPAEIARRAVSEAANLTKAQAFLARQKARRAQRPVAPPTDEGATHG